ncbi:arginine decarboxylase [Craterilacuibacter sinensis]|uniref:Biosynthetic arginine decarboxylase n=1 Tax=Craterilacuibacter sinensis TaxID=2686017 RepID=A0A845BN60_9NEIS|nr:arginine decarboxylase [Craterilacuibacter sinensis]MXR36840.1 arginine decarboxylase [Craterilacuibacter sinensis]
MAWTVADSRSLYGIRHWGDGYFDIADNGCVSVRPNAALGEDIDLMALLQRLYGKNLDLPLLIRFPDILQNRVTRLCRAFDDAIAQAGYGNRYTAIYPIKVNQQEAVIKSIIATPDVSIGLEAGSKPELMAVLALSPIGGTIVCNGYKDREFIRLALIGQKLGHEVFIVIEKEIEVDLVIEEAARLGVRPWLGMRVRLSSLASGKWADTGGDKAKFGLSAAQLISAADKLAAAGMADCVRLMHFHMGSQIAHLEDYRKGFGEAIRYYGELRALGLPIDHVDVGGGLGVDYDGTHSRNESSINYDIDEYAQAIVGLLTEFCADNDLPQPRIFSESGRAMTAHHAVLVMNVTDVERLPDAVPAVADVAALALPIRKLLELTQLADAEMVTETYYRASHLVSDVAELYTAGRLSLKEKALAETIHAALCRRLQRQLSAGQRSQRQAYDDLTERLADKYFCNFSVFQSLPDTWAIDQVLPLMPIHRLDEEPTRRAVLQDLTCDSDGKVKQYVDGQSIETSMAVHEVKAGEEYLIGVFLVGAYQEILGDMHNLFGDTDSVNVYQYAGGMLECTGVEEHDTIEDMLRYVHLSPEELLERYRHKMSVLDISERGSYLAEFARCLKQSSYLSL